MKQIVFCTAAALSILLFSGCAAAPDPTAAPSGEATLPASDSPAPVSTPDSLPTPSTAPSSDPAFSPSPDIGETAAPAVSKRDNIPFSDGHSYAVAYLGYQEITGLDDYVERYLDSGAIPIHYLSSGDYYLVIPRYSGMELSLYQNDIETGDSVLRVQDPDCRPFIIQCNASDIFPDATIRLAYEGETVEFSPFISLMDGSVDIGGSGLDITNADI